MQSGLISVMMPAYNAEQYIRLAIESVLAQSYPHWELIIVNDGSKDNTAAIVSEYTHDLRIKLINQENGGESAARNTALEHVQGKFIAFLDADDMYLSNHLEVAINALKAHLDQDAIYTDGYHIDQNGAYLQLLSANRRGPFEGRIFEQVVRASDVFGPPGSVVMRSEQVFRYNLRFDTDLVIGPDWDFLMRYSDIANFGYVDQRTYLYRIHPSNISVQTNAHKRLLSQAKCRTKAIKMKNFSQCSLQTRQAVFYDLLIELLPDFPEKQSAVTQWSEFKDLPSVNRAYLFRLMANKAVVHGNSDSYIKKWLYMSKSLNALDYRRALFSALYHISPKLCQFVLCTKVSRRPKKADIFGRVG